ncbi:MAG: HEPN domain-containing protein [Thermoproteota archaeon]
MDKLRLLIPIVQSVIKPLDHLSIALQRYNDSLFKTDPIEGLTYTIMGLEALFLKSLEHEELEHRLAQRAAKCLSIIGYQQLEVYNIIKQSYDVRSEFIHGYLVSEEKRLDASKLCDKIVEFLRSSVIVFMQLKEKVEKRAF